MRVGALESEITGNATEKGTCLLTLRRKDAALTASHNGGPALATARAYLLERPGGSVDLHERVA
jgi:hypothetical protein